jgi:hypothetical protein
MVKLKKSHLVEQNSEHLGIGQHFDLMDNWDMMQMAKWQMQWEWEELTYKLVCLELTSRASHSKMIFG